MSTDAYGVVHFFAGGTKAQYDAGKLPDGQLFHAAGPSDGGWTILAVHESKESWEQFRDGVLLPKMQAGIEGGFTSPPSETTVDLDTLIS